MSDSSKSSSKQKTHPWVVIGVCFGILVLCGIIVMNKDADLAFKR